MNLSTTICGVLLRNRSVLASGILGVTLSSLKRVYNEGAGIVTSKSIGIKPRKGHRGPIIYDYGAGIINAVGLSNPGVESFIDQNRNYHIDFPVILSIFGEKIEDYPILAKKLGELNCDFIEINISCPNVEDEFGMPFSYSRDLTYKITQSVKAVVDKPIIVKLSPNTPEIITIALAAQEAGADCINIINTVGPGMVINVNTGYPILSNLKGGISGDAVLPLTVRHVYELYKSLSIPIIGTGGISSVESALQVLMAGARLFGIGTAIYTKGISVFNKINNEIIEFMKKNRIYDLEEIIGISHRLNKKSKFFFSFDQTLTQNLKLDKKQQLIQRPDFLVSDVKEVMDDDSKKIRQLYLNYFDEDKPAPGQFYMLWIPGVDLKPFSVLSYSKQTLGFAIAKRGEFSKEVFNLEIGNAIGVLGPLGNGFDLTKSNYLLLAGGIGLAPLIFTAEVLLRMNKKVSLMFGAKTSDDVSWLEYYIEKKGSEQFKKLPIYHITEDGSKGKKGLITDYIEEVIDEVRPDFTLVCGPELFIKKAAEICVSLGINGEASIERMMKCGIGLCGSCSLDNSGTRVCKDGPVFDFNKLLKFTEFGKYKRDESGRIVNI